MEKMVISTIVFSAMCLEAFFNNYIAAILGDDRFYDIYDGLTPQNKFCFISEFIFGERVDKSQECYGGLKTLIKYRNEFVHNKSTEVKMYQPSALQQKEFKEVLELTSDEFGVPLLNKAELDKDLRRALEALKTIRNVARYFDKYDSSCYAMIELFRESNYAFASSYEKIYLEDIFEKLNIKRGPKYEI